MNYNNKLIDRDISWLSFNARVLQEASDKSVPLIERLRFLGIFSSNLDEFFRVRVASIKRIADLKRKSSSLNTKEAKKILAQVKEIVLAQQQQFEHLYENEIKEELKQNQIEIIDEKQLDAKEIDEVNAYYKNKVSPQLFPIILDDLRSFPNLQDGQIYLAIKIKLNQVTSKFAIVNIPSRTLGRFYVIKNDTNCRILLLDDIIRLNINELFKSFDAMEIEAFTIKLSRDAELDIENTGNASVIEQLYKGLKMRKRGVPTRFIYDKWISVDLLKYLIDKLKIEKNQAIPGGKYHNFKDFIKFPDLGHTNLIYSKIEPLLVKKLENKKSLIQEIIKRDIMIAYPYESFEYMPLLLREAALNPNVTEINATLYRLAEMSYVANALINAVRNGKKVKVLTELRARFMEEANMEWAEKLADAGVEIINTIPDYKVHCKLFQIKIQKGAKTETICHVGTGNFNEITAKMYCDFSLLTANKKINSEVSKVFRLLQNFKPSNYKFETLWVSPINTRSQLVKLINNEIQVAKSKKKARILIKVNSLEDKEICEKLYEAINAGVQVDLIVRGIFRLKLKGNLPHVRAVSIIDRYLEHSRIFYFYNQGTELMFMGSADIMKRNIDYRVEVTTPIHDEKHKQVLLSYLELQLADNVKGRKLIKNLKNDYVACGKKKVQSQIDFHKILQTAETE